MKRRIFLVVALIALVLVLGSAENKYSAEAAEFPEIAFQLDWNPFQVYHLGFLMAQQLGFYDQEGLSIKFLPGMGSQHTVTMMGANKVVMGSLDGSVLPSAREKGIRIKAVASLLESNPEALFFWKKDIEKPEDLKGKIVVADSKSFLYVMVKILIFKAGLSPGDLKIMDFSGLTGGRFQLLLSKRADATGANVFSAYYKQKALRDIEGIGYFLFSGHGVNAINKVIAADEEFLKKNPEAVRRFLRATAKGWEYALKNPREAIHALKQSAPEQNEETVLLEMFNNMLPFVKSPRTQGLTWGKMSHEDWEDTKNILVEAKIIIGKENVADFFTNDLLPK